jgi:uncharacterized protein (DUF2164 family)
MVFSRKDKRHLLESFEMELNTKEKQEVEQDNGNFLVDFYMSSLGMVP